MRCHICNYIHDNEGDRYGCPNCEGDTSMAMSNAEKQAAWRARQRDKGLITVTVMAPAKDKTKLEAYAKALRKPEKIGLKYIDVSDMNVDEITDISQCGLSDKT